MNSSRFSLKRILIIAPVSLAGLFLAAVLIIGFDYYAPASPQKTYPIPTPQDDTLRIAFIGDSWAFFHGFHPCKMQAMLQQETSRPVKIVSKGCCGARSSSIYMNLFADEGDTFKDIMMISPQFCIVSAGVNDTYTKTGASAYASNMEKIVRFMTESGIVPVIIEIPDYDIRGAYERQSIQKKMLRHLSMFITGSDIDCRAAYRTALEEKLSEEKPRQDIISIRRQEWHDHPGLYRSDCLHLNDNGYLALDSCIARRIATYIATKTEAFSSGQSR